MAEYPALPLFTDALLADTAHLSNEEFGIYMRLLVLMWRSPAARIPAEPSWVCKRMGVTEENYPVMLEPIIKEFCKSDGNFISQKRLKRELDYLRDRSKKQKERIKKRWEAQKQTVPDKSLKPLQTDLYPEYTDSGITPTPTPTPTPPLSKKEYIPVPSASAPEIGMAFEGIWNAFPGVQKNGVVSAGQKGSKNKAREIFTQLVTTEGKTHGNTFRIVRAGVENYARWIEQSGQPSRSVANWLKDRGFEDDYTISEAIRSGGGDSRSRKTALDFALADRTRDPDAADTARYDDKWNSPVDDDQERGQLLDRQAPRALPKPQGRE